MNSACLFHFFRSKPPIYQHIRIIIIIPILLSFTSPISTLALLIPSRKGRRVKYPDARRNPTTASRFFTWGLLVRMPSNSFISVFPSRLVKKLDLRGLVVSLFIYNLSTFSYFTCKSSGNILYFQIFAPNLSNYAVFPILMPTISGIKEGINTFLDKVWVLVSCTEIG